MERPSRSGIASGLALVLLLVSSCSHYESYSPSTEPIGTVSGSTGFPSVVRNARSYILAEQSRIFAGDLVSTDEQSLLEISLQDGTLVHIGTRSRLLMTSHQPDGRVTNRLNLSGGSLELKSSSLVNHQITTSLATVTARSDHLWIGYNREGTEMDVVLVGQGEGEVSNEDGRIELTQPLQSCRVLPGAAPLPPVQWGRERFNRSRQDHNRIERQ